MARPKTETATQKIESAESTVQAVAQKNNATQATKKIKVKEILRGSYGAFNPGEVVEVPGLLATAFINAGLAEEYKEKD